MNRVVNTFRSFKNYLSNHLSKVFHNYPDDENSDPNPNLDVSLSGKRQHDENLPEVCLKKRKLDLVDSANSEELSSSLTDEKMPSKQKPPKQNTRARGKKSNSSPTASNAKMTKTSAYSCSSPLVDVTNEGSSNRCGSSQMTLRSTVSTPGNEGRLLRRTNSINTQQGFSQTKSPFSTRRFQSNPSCLEKMHQDSQKKLFNEMVKKSAGASPHKRKLLPLITSTVHNTKQNNQVVSNTISGKGYFLRNSTALSKQSSNVEMIVNAREETVADKTVIDLTEEDDLNQRKMIEINVRNSPRLKNFRSSLVLNTRVTNPDFLTDMLKKYTLKQSNLRSQVQKVEQTMRKGNEDLHKSLVECLEQRLSLKEHAEDKRTKDLAPMTEAMMEDVGKILNSGKKPLVQIKDTGIKAQDIYTLHDCNWLNDEVINAYMNLIKNRSEDDKNTYPKVHCFNTFFYAQLLNRGYSSVRRWTKKIDLFDHTIVIVPIHLGNHWCLVEIRMEEKVIKYYDSLGSPNNRCLETMMDYLTNEYEDKKGGKLNSKEWQVVNVSREEIPNQKNAYDCGVFACTYAEHITRNERFCFDQGDMNYFREKMTYEILTGKLLL